MASERMYSDGKKRKPAQAGFSLWGRATLGFSL
jgi:hypothetical protein